jgi:hypothetical protein
MEGKPGFFVSKALLRCPELLFLDPARPFRRILDFLRQERPHTQLWALQTATGTANVRAQPGILARVRDVMRHPGHTDEVMRLLLTHPRL